MSEPRTSSSRYFVSHNGETKGPFDLDMIEAFILSGHYPEGVQICREGTDDWNRHTPKNEFLPPPATHPTTPQGGSPAPSGIPKWVFIGGGVIGVCVLVSMFNESGSTSQRPSPNYSPVTTSTPVATPRYSSPHTTSYSAPVPATTPANRIYKDAHGNSYSVSNSDYQRLSRQRDGLTQEESEISTIQSKIDAYAENLDREKTYLDHTSQAAIDAYNDKVDKLNNANAQMKRRLSTFNAGVDSFNAELARVGTPIR